MKKLILTMMCGMLAFCAGAALFAEDHLSLGTGDIRLECERAPGYEGVPASELGFSGIAGYHLYIRKKPGIESVMLTESLKDETGRRTDYAYRATEYNTVNGDEIRLYNGRILTDESARYSLIDSTPEPDNEFDLAFHIYVPTTVTFGNEWGRHDTRTIDEGTFVNIRTFSRKYADYAGDFAENAYEFRKNNAQ